ncbi:trypsin-like cysteine/serine peptidase domain-containing protein [Stachybotrys elegans]|uniref:Trypsin-like cysteine/serine peptidase domain-containing protein n=1 Tax=Stachybotrys elegans TaxID=80388 RepID=A0A8K0T016_9HYPO|nr:trypsin-like cysteine/serine peptidase domain-containing protein [Stachybotrys elegans]
MLTKFPTSYAITPLAGRVTASVTRLPSSDHRILLKKRAWLHKYTVLVPPDLKTRGVPNPAGATLVFAQEEAGTAICLSPNGVLLTCSHCVAETEQELSWDKQHWLLFASGDVVAAKTIAWDAKRDLALMIITSASQSSFPHIRLSSSAPKLRASLLCVGHPGSEDLEASIPGVQTNYDTLVLSKGRFRGLAAGQDPQDNQEIGALMHDCWTYWGHSGAPLVDANTGCLVGVHSSWDEDTGMRRGIPWQALSSFLEEVDGSGQRLPEGWKWYQQ